MKNFPLKGVVVLVTGAARGIGRGVAIELGKLGATVYITGRKSSQSDQAHLSGLPTLKDTANEIEKAGGNAIPVYCDHSNADETKLLFEQIDREQNGRLDILVNNAFSAVLHLLSNLGKKFYEIDNAEQSYDLINNVGLKNVYLCCIYASRLMVKRNSGLIVNISSIGGLNYLFNVAYGFGKQALDRMMADIAIELQDTGVKTFSLWPGGVQTELIKSIVLSNPQNEGSAYFFDGESPHFPGRVIAFIYQNKLLMAKYNGKIVTTTEIAQQFDVKDLDGRIHPCKRSHFYDDYIKQTNEIRLEALNN